MEFPSSFWYNTVSNYNLKKDEEAIKSGLALLKLDTQHHYPEVNRLLAELSLNKKDYSAAADYLKTYLAQVPQAKDAEIAEAAIAKDRRGQRPTAEIVDSPASPKLFNRRQ